MDHTNSANRAFGFRFAKFFLPHDQLSPRVGEFIVNLHQIDAPDAMARSALALDTPNCC